MRFDLHISVRTIAPVVIALLTTAMLLSTCSNKRVTDRELTKVGAISDYINQDQVAMEALPLIWFDTTSRASRYGDKIAGKLSDAQTSINPLDYWIEVTKAGRGIDLRPSDTCQFDEMTQQMNCNQITLSNGLMADAEIAQMHDTIGCTYYIVNRSDSTIYTKAVEYRVTSTALMAQTDRVSALYKGWRLYAIGRQSHGTGITPNRFPAIDSIVVQSLDRNEVRFVDHPDAAARYDDTRDLLRLNPGELLEVSVYSRPRFGNPPISDAYVDHEVAGVFTHEWMGGSISGSSENQLHSWDIRENSGGATNHYSQITVELFQGDALRDSSPGVFSVLTWAITYRLE